jgi:hypothetical protein
LKTTTWLEQLTKRVDPQFQIAISIGAPDEVNERFCHQVLRFRFIPLLRTCQKSFCVERCRLGNLPFSPRESFVSMPRERCYLRMAFAIFGRSRF